MKTRFQHLPREDKRLLLISGGHSPAQPASQHPGLKGVAEAMRTQRVEAFAGKKPLTFGDFVAGVCRTWGQRRAKGIIDLAIKVHVIEFRGSERFVIS